MYRTFNFFCASCLMLPIFLSCAPPKVCGYSLRWQNFCTICAYFKFYVIIFILWKSLKKLLSNGCIHVPHSPRHCKEFWKKMIDIMQKMWETRSKNWITVTQKACLLYLILINIILKLLPVYSRVSSI